MSQNGQPQPSLGNAGEPRGISLRASRRFPTETACEDQRATGAPEVVPQLGEPGHHRGAPGGCIAGSHDCTDQDDRTAHRGPSSGVVRRRDGGAGLSGLLGDGGLTAHCTPHGRVDHPRGQDSEIAPVPDDGDPPDVVLEHLAERPGWTRPPRSGGFTPLPNCVLPPRAAVSVAHYPSRVSTFRVICSICGSRPANP
jgi:hypothetical protein